MEIKTELDMGQDFFVFDTINSDDDPRCHEVKISKEKVTGIKVGITTPGNHKTISYVSDSNWTYNECIVYKTRKEAFLALEKYFFKVFDRVEGRKARAKE